MLARGLGARWVGVSVMGALVAFGCAANEELPRVGRETDDRSTAGAAGSGSDDEGSGGNGTGGSGGGTGGTDTVAEEVPHDLYLYGIRASDETRHVCDMTTDTVVGTSTVNHSDTVGQVHPTTGAVWMLEGGTGLVEDVSEHEDACGGLVEDFSFHPATGALATECDGTWYDETGATTVQPAKYRDKDGRFFDRGELFDAAGASIPLDTSLAAMTFAAVHSRPGGGFFALTLSEDDDVITRYTISAGGAVDVVAATGTSASAGVDFVTLGAALDALGGVWLQGDSDAYPDGAVVRLSSNLSSAEIVYTGGNCDLTEYWGLVFSTP